MTMTSPLLALIVSFSGVAVATPEPSRGPARAACERTLGALIDRVRPRRADVPAIVNEVVDRQRARDDYGLRHPTWFDLRRVRAADSPGTRALRAQIAAAIQSHVARLAYAPGPTEVRAMALRSWWRGRPLSHQELTEGNLFRRREPIGLVH